MTGYLERLAARAAGHEPAVTPRLPARFEAAGAAPPAPNAPAATPGVAPRAAAPPVDAPSRPRAEAPVVRRRDELPARPAPSLPTPPSASPDQGVRAPDQPEASVLDDAPRPGLGRPRAVAVTDSAGPESHEPARTTAAPRPGPDPMRAGAAPDGLRVAAAPAIATAEPRVVVPRPEMAPERSGPDVVRVSIGRVEVRATLPPPQPAAPRSEPREPAAALSLRDYLSGKREAT